MGHDLPLAAVPDQDTIAILGVTGSQITLLRELSAEEASAWTEHTAPPCGETGTPMPFQDALWEVWKQRKK